MPDSKFDVIVIGAGITGLTAAKYAAQRGFATANIEALLFGGLVININELDGEPHGSGTELASNLMMEVSDLGAANIAETVTALAREGDLLSVVTDAGRYRARAVIIASGARLRRLGIPGEAKFEHRGVSQCADCDGPMYKDQDVVVVGGGDSALQEALVLAGFCRRVHVVHRGTQFRARRHLADAVAARNNIHPLWNTVADEILGAEMVTRVRVRNVLDGVTTEIPCTGLFAYIGLEPRCEFAPPEIQRDVNGGLMTDASLQTAMPGVFAAGAVRAGYGGLLTHAIAEGDAAARALTAQLRG